MVVRELITKLRFNVDNSQLKKYEGSIESVKSKISSFGAGLGRIGGLMSLVGGAVATAGITAFGKSVLETTGQIERYRVTLGSMVGDQEKVNELIDKLNSSALSDFYGTDAAIGGLQGMITFGMNAEESADALMRLGDIAQGNTEAFKSLSLNLGQVYAKGKADGTDLKQFIMQGFDVVGEVARVTGKSREEIEKAGVGYKETMMALRNLTSEGGKYYEMLNKQSDTLTGLVKQFQSLGLSIKESVGNEVIGDVKSIMRYFLELGRSIKDDVVGVASRGFKAIIKGFANVVVAFQVVSQRTKKFEGFRKLISGIVSVLKIVGKVLMGLFIGLAPVVDKIAGVFSNIVGFINNNSEAFIKFGQIALAVILGIVVAVKTFTIIMGVAKAIMLIFNIICMANPLALIVMAVVVAIGLLIAGIVAIIKNWDKVKQAFSRFKDWCKNLFNSIVESVKSIWNGITDFFIGLWGGIKNVFSVFVDWIQTLFENPIEALKQAWSGITDFFYNLWENIFSIFTGFTDKVKDIWGGIKDFFGFGDSDVNVNNTKTISPIDKAKESVAGVSNSYASTINNNSNPATINSNSNIVVNVPTGTNAEQSQAISKQVKEQIEASWMDMLNGSRSMIPTPEARSF